MMTGPDAWARVLDKLDRIDDRLRVVEIMVAEVQAKQEANRSRISTEIQAAKDDDESLVERVEKLELSAAEDKGARKGSWKLLAAIAAASSGSTAALMKAASALIGVGT